MYANSRRKSVRFETLFIVPLVVLVVAAAFYSKILTV